MSLFTNSTITTRPRTFPSLHRARSVRRFLIVVANTIENATALYRYIAGYADGTRSGKTGATCPLFSNVDSDDWIAAAPR